MQPAITQANDEDDVDTLPPSAFAPEPEGRARIRVLVVEPAPLIRLFIDRALTAHGYQVHCIASLAELDAALEFRPELALIELNLADGSGDKACNRMRAQLAARVPVVLMSRGSEADLQRRSALCDADRCFSKMHGLNVLLPLVDEIALDLKDRAEDRDGLA